MKTATIMQVQHNFSKVLRGLKSGEKIAITRHKQVVAELLPPSPDAKPVFPDFEARARRTWGGEWSGASSDELLRESRGDR